MSSTGMALVGIGGMFLLMLLRVPVGFAMLLAGLVGLCLAASPEAAVNVLSTDIWNQFSSCGLSVIPMFVFMGQIAFRSGMTERLYDAAYK